MLREIEGITGIGLFHDSGPSPAIARIALVFGENGRGKSTLAAVLRSCGENNGADLARRATLGAHLPASACVVFDGHTEPARYASGSWSRSHPEVVVFDAEFVSRNVYAGSTVSPDQRLNLLEFALGEGAVSAKRAHASAVKALAEATAKSRGVSARIDARRGPISLAEYRKLEVPADGDAQISKLEAQLDAAKNIAAIKAKAAPLPVPMPAFDVVRFFDLLAESLPTVAATAEAEVKYHLRRANRGDFEAWIAQGMNFDLGDSCPYCAQSTQDLSLVKAYQAHFNGAYTALKDKAAAIEDGLNRRLGQHALDGVLQMFERAQGAVDGWADRLLLPAVGFDATGFATAFNSLRSLLAPLARQKALTPLEAVGSPELLDQARSLLATACSYVDASNSRIAAAGALVNEYKTKLDDGNASSLTATIDRIRRSSARHTPEAIAELKELDEILKEVGTLTKNKDQAREALDALMQTTLSRYKVEINALLRAFGAQMSIEKFDLSYKGAGAAPRSDYGISLRGTEIKLSDGDGASFGNCLSEGDKRSLAFAFFLARFRADPQLIEKIIVIDDPMCSLDRRRRSATINALVRLAPGCKQLVVMAHDAFFLQDLNDQLVKQKRALGLPSRLKIGIAPGGFSIFTQLDLDEECMGIYQQEVQLLKRYSQGEQGLSKIEVAKALRTVLESSIHRQFPGEIARGLMLGQCIEAIRNAQPPMRVAALAQHVAELHSINHFATQFHHSEGEPPVDESAIDEGELHSFCERVLAFVFRS